MPNDFNYSMKVFIFTMTNMTRISHIQTEALMEIAASEVSLDGGIAMKAIAEDALIEVFTLGAETEAKILQN